MRVLKDFSDVREVAVRVVSGCVYTASVQEMQNFLDFARARYPLDIERAKCPGLNLQLLLMSIGRIFVSEKIQWLEDSSQALNISLSSR
jgi:hypothetical protein